MQEFPQKFAMILLVIVFFITTATINFSAYYVHKTEILKRTSAICTKYTTSLREYQNCMKLTKNKL
jgi:hypothetical protein